MSSWIRIDPKILQLAIKEYEKLGLEGTRKKFGFGPANRVHMYYGGKGKPFEARVLAAVAHSIMYPNRERLSPKSFKDLGSVASKYLETVGFEARPIVRKVGKSS